MCIFTFIFEVLSFVEPVSSTSFTRDGQCVLTSTMDDSIKLMDKDTGEMLNEYLSTFLFFQKFAMISIKLINPFIITVVLLFSGRN